MRFTLSSSALSSKLSALSKVINSKNALPILGDFVFDIEDQVLTLTASDGENTMRTIIGLTDSDGNGRFAIGNHDLLEAVKGISEQPITFDANQEQNLVKISYQNGLFSLPIENADEFPMAQPIGDNAYTITMPNIAGRECEPQHLRHRTGRAAPRDERYLLRPDARLSGSGGQRRS